MTDTPQQPPDPGVMWGRLTSLEARTDRLETAISTRLASIESKIEAMMTALIEQRGVRNALSWLEGWGKLIAASGLGMAATWLMTHMGHR